MTGVTATPPDRDPSRDLWEEHAGWWIDGFTDGADPEYEEQILPIAAAELGDALTILDIGCGDGQISRMMASVGADVVGIDPTANQIRVAHERGGGAAYLRATADELPFADASFDAVTVSFGLRNVAGTRDALAEMLRVTRPGGRIVVCEFSSPTWPPFRVLYTEYLVRALPAIARVVSSDPESYEYLADSIRAWPDQVGLARLLREAGWTHVAYRNLSGGIVALHRGRRP